MTLKIQSILAVSTIALTMNLAGCLHDDDITGSPTDPGMDSGENGSDGDSDSDGDDGDTIAEGSEVATEAGDTAAKVIAEGRALEASPRTSSSGITIDYATGAVRKTSPQAFALKKNDTGGVDMTVNGETISFSADDNMLDGGWSKTEEGGAYAELYARTMNTDNVLDGSDTSYVHVWEYFTESEDRSTVDAAFAVVGAETPGEVVKSQASATYLGGALARTRSASDASERTDVRGDLTLNADFAAGSISGTLANLEGRTRGADTGGAWSSWQDADGTITMAPATISGNSFTGGSLSADGPASLAMGGNIAGSSYSGRFYGPDAEQVSGVMSIEGTGDGDKFLGSGFFLGEKQNP